jgi:hypothetical protein
MAVPEIDPEVVKLVLGWLTPLKWSLVILAGGLVLAKIIQAFRRK